MPNLKPNTPYRCIKSEMSDVYPVGTIVITDDYGQFDIPRKGADGRTYMSTFCGDAGTWEEIKEVVPGGRDEGAKQKEESMKGKLKQNIGDATFTLGADTEPAIFMIVACATLAAEERDSEQEMLRYISAIANERATMLAMKEVETNV